MILNCSCGWQKFLNRIHSHYAVISISFSNPVILHNIVVTVFRLGLEFVKLKLSVTWEITVMGVVNVLNITEDSRNIVIVKFITCFMDVVFNSVSVLVVNIVVSEGPLNEVEILGTIDRGNVA